jgi:hypothetical protein
MRTKPVNGRAKGSGFERKIAKILSNWSGHDLRRTPLSGGWSRQNPETTGDIVSISKGADFPFSVECKNQEGWRMEAILLGKCKVFDDWWQQTIQNCPEHKVPMLVFSKAYSIDWVCLRHNEIVIDRLTYYSIIGQGARAVVSLEEYLRTHSVADYIEGDLSVNNRASVRQRQNHTTDSGLSG